MQITFDITLSEISLHIEDTTGKLFALNHYYVKEIKYQ